MSKDEYLIQPQRGLSRVDQEVYDRVREQTAKWEIFSTEEFEEGMCGNIRPQWNPDKYSFEWVEGLGALSTHLSMSRVISSALLVYRLMCLFGGPVTVESDRYKCIWWVGLRHKGTDDVFMLGEWKGAAGIWTKYHKLQELKKEFADDILALLNKLCSEDCPHPYDGTVAGSVA